MFYVPGLKRNSYFAITENAKEQRPESERCWKAYRYIHISYIESDAWVQSWRFKIDHFESDYFTPTATELLHCGDTNLIAKHIFWLIVFAHSKFKTAHRFGCQRQETMRRLLPLVIQESLKIMYLSFYFYPFPVANRPVLPYQLMLNSL